MKYTINIFSQPVKTKIDYKKDLNDEQYEVLQNAQGPCLVLAGAGSGKTRTLVYLAAYLLEHGIDPKNIMLVTFTNKAAREMLNRVEALLHAHPKGLWGGTFHHLANAIVRKYAESIGYTNSFSILDEEDSKSFLKNCMADLSISPKKEYFPKADVLHSLFSFSQNSLLGISDIISERYTHIKEEMLPSISRIFEDFQNKKKNMNAMNFDDLLFNWRLLLKDHPDIQKRLSSQLHYVLVDEYQDTNTLQAEIIEMISLVHRNVVVVGDDSQSIYSFRAANVNNILNFPKKFEGAKIFKLQTNYRSTPEILHLANHSIKNNQWQHKKDLKSVKESSKLPALVPLGDSYEQANFICQRVLELKEEGADLHSLAVLFRSAFQALELELELNKRNIPYELRGGLRFFEQAHIKDIIAYLKAFNNIKDELAWKRVLELYAGIGRAYTQKIWEHIQKFSDLKPLVESSIHIAARTDKSFHEAMSLFKKLLALEKQFIPTALEIILRAGFQKYVENTFENAQERLEDLEQLINFSLSYTKLDDFLSEVTLSEAFKGDKQKAYKETQDDALILTTIHQAKGLEWKVVFLIGLVDGQFPHYKNFDRPHELEEERRLFYVAVTRAKDELYLTYPIISSSFRTGESINRPSLFIRELKEGLLEKWEVGQEFDLPIISYDEDEKPDILKRIREL